MKEKKKILTSEPPKDFAFAAANYKLTIAGIVIILVGFFIMTLDSSEFGFGFLGLTLGPIIVMAGFVLEFWALFKKTGNG